MRSRNINRFKILFILILLPAMLCFAQETDSLAADSIKAVTSLDVSSDTVKQIVTPKEKNPRRN